MIYKTRICKKCGVARQLMPETKTLQTNGYAIDHSWPGHMLWQHNVYKLSVNNDFDDLHIKEYVHTWMTGWAGFQ